MSAALLETQHLNIRELTLADAEDVYKLIHSCDGGVDSKLSSLSKEDFIHHHESYILYQYAFYGYGIWGLFLKDDSFIGAAGVANGDESDVGELSYALLPQYRGCGYAYEACKEIVDYALSEEIGFKKLYVQIEEGNTASTRLADKLGLEIRRSIDQ